MFKSRFFVLAVVCGSLLGCLNTGVKTLGTSSSGSTVGSTNNADPFVINLAYRNSNPSTNLVYQIVGGTDNTAESFQSTCGSDGSSCACDFYQSTSDSSPLTSTNISYSLSTNTISCTLPSSATPANYTYIRLRTTSSSQVSGYLNVTNTLTLQQALNSTALSTTAVRKIYNYSCVRTFLEGEGVSGSGSGSSITCLSGQHLGFIYGNYNFYLYQSESGTDLNTNVNGTVNTNTFYNATGTPSGICSKAVAQYSCGNYSAPVFGLYPTAAGQFTQGLVMQASPTIGQAVYGYAALPDASGNCPVGLVKITPYVAQPYSILLNSLGTNPPSNFINNAGSLNDKIWVPATSGFSNFTVTRQANSTPCCTDSSCTSPKDANGNYVCTYSAVGGTTALTPVTYGVQTPSLCAIPASLL